MMENIQMDPVLLQAGIALLAVLGGVNAFFIKALVQKIDKADKSISKYEEQIRQLKEQVEAFSIFIKDFSELKSEVAVLKYALEHRSIVPIGIKKPKP